MSNTAGVVRDAQGRTRTVPGQPTSGRFAVDPTRRRDGELLTATVNRWPATPDEDQVIRAGAEASRRHAINPEAGIDVEALQKRLSYAIAEQESCYRAFVTGTSHPDDDAYEAIWSGEARGVSEDQVSERLGFLRAQHSELSSGRGNPETVVGAGATEADRSMAVDVIEANIDTLIEAESCHGRNLSINQIAVCQTRIIEQEAAVPF